MSRLTAFGNCCKPLIESSKVLSVNTALGPQTVTSLHRTDRRSNSASLMESAALQTTQSAIVPQALASPHSQNHSLRLLGTDGSSASQLPLAESSSVYRQAMPPFEL